MIVTRIELTNLRVIEAAEFHFQPGFNLIVGVNGVGKTSVLDALGVCLSGIVKYANGLRYRVRKFSPIDLRAGAEALTIQSKVQLDGREYTYLVHQPGETSVAEERKVRQPGKQVYDTPVRSEFIGDVPSRLAGSKEGLPLAMLFSTRRALTTAREPSNMAAAGGIAAACADAFANRNLRFGEFAAWMRMQHTLAAEQPSAKHVLASFGAAVSRFLPEYSNLRVDNGQSPQLLIDRSAVPLPVAQLSDGERGTLSMVLDLTRRLAQANPTMKDPAAEAEAVVLIDEIELHLHPTWQRRIIKNLTDTFPKCQFIATTHSPQIIGEVEHDQIQIMANGEVYPPTHSYGVDSSRVLEEIMDAYPRAENIAVLLNEISGTIRDDRYDDARELLHDLSSRLGENDPEVTRIQTLLDFLAGEA